jgi:D-aminoacyl-tRNA deacylase
LFRIEGFSSKERGLDLEENEIYLGLTKDPLIFLNDLKLNESEIRPDFLIFASRHSSKTERPAFLVHTTGNWSENTDFGGKSKDLSLTSALLHKSGFLSLLNQEGLEDLGNFSVDIEVSHHGPTLIEKPLIFMELGSKKEEWVIREAGEFLAISILKTIFKFIELNASQSQKVGVGFGGTHYAPNFNRLIQTKDIAMSFICPKYYIQELDYDLITKMVDNTSEKVDYFIIDWKGTNSEDKKHLIPLLEEFDIPIKKTKEF